MRKIQLVVNTRLMKEISEDEDFAYWLSKPVFERLRAVTLLVSQTLKPGQRLDKSAFQRRKLKWAYGITELQELIANKKASGRSQD